MQALLVGGPLHGTLVPLKDEKAVSITSEATDGVSIYVRRSSGGTMGSETSLFVFGRPTYEEVQDAVRRSNLTKTAKLRVLGSDGEVI